MTSQAAGDHGVVRSFVEHEHRELDAGIGRIHDLACRLAELPAHEMAARVDGVLHWVSESLRPHMAWEEAWLRPQAVEGGAARWAMRLVTFDHRQITALTDRLTLRRAALDHGPAAETVCEVRGELFGLEALLRADLEREACFLLPMLDPDESTWPIERRS
jgi:hypothetical protein